MSARNIYHDTVIHALEADGWTITDDPLRISFGGRDLYVDLGAQRETIGAQRGDEKIGVEVQSFLSPSPVHDLHGAVGQFEIYRTFLARMEPDRMLFLAVPEHVYDSLLVEPFGQVLIADLQLRILVFDDEKEKVLRWIK